MALSFGGVTLKHGLMLAPMAGATDLSFRELCRLHGAEYTVTEMISAKALVLEQSMRRTKAHRTAQLATVTQAEAPTAIQIFGHEPDIMAEAARLLATGEYAGAVSTARPVAIDINMGCPVPKIVNNGEGSALMKEPDTAVAIVRAVKAAVKLPVTVKMRAGWDSASRNAPELAQRLEDAGADLLCVHGRTRQQFYEPFSDNRIIAAVKAAVSVPVIGNGDLCCAADVTRMIEETGCDGVMIGRGALGNPFVFREVCAALESRPYTPPTMRERMETALAHACDMIARKGERVALAEVRKHMSWYCRGVRGAAAVRNALMRAESQEAIRAALQGLLEIDL